MVGPSRPNNDPFLRIRFALKCLNKGRRSRLKAFVFFYLDNAVRRGKETFPAAADSFAKTFWPLFLYRSDRVVGGEEQNGFWPRHGPATCTRTIWTTRVNMGGSYEAAIF